MQQQLIMCVRQWVNWLLYLLLWLWLDGGANSVVYLALGVWLPLSLPDSGKKTSDYWKLLTNEHGHDEAHH